MPDVSQIGIVIVTYNSAETIGPCLDSALGSGAQVVVVDNASRDGTQEEVARRPAATLVANPWNRGFAGAVNQGIGLLNRPYILLLNPDAVLQGGLDAMASACSRPDVAAAGGKLVDERGRPQTGFMVRRLPAAASLVFEMLGLNRIWPSNRVNRRYRCLDLDPQVPAEVEQPAGAFLMIRREVWRELAGFDEDFYPLWFEDVDFLKRARDAGYRVVYLPEALAVHQGGRSAAKLAWGQRQLYWYDSLLKYAAKHFRPGSLRATCGAAILACALRTAVGVLSGSIRPLRVYIEIIRLAGLRLVSGRNEGGALVSVPARR